jgi:hypothetical protein
MKALEKQVEALLVKACKTKGFKCIKGSVIYNAGFPDRIVFNTKTKNIFYIEVKNEGYYKLTPLQLEWKKIIQESGGSWFMINGEDEMITFINTYIKGEK